MVKRYDIYRNLRRKNYSVKDRETGCVVRRSESLFATDVTFVVQESGRRRVLREGVKNVHAFVRAEFFATCDGDLHRNGGRWVRVMYNPYRTEGFVNPEGRIVDAARCIELTPEGAFAHDPIYREE